MIINLIAIFTGLIGFIILLHEVRESKQMEADELAPVSDEFV